MKKINKQIKPVSSSTEEFINGITTFSEKYPHLQVFLHHQRENHFTQDYEFLMVSPGSFGKVVIQDLNYEDPDVIVEFLDCTLQEIGHLRINVNDANPRVLFVCWSDIRQMVQADKINNIDNSELLEFDY